jgi:hypothetical protein
MFPAEPDRAVDPGWKLVNMVSDGQAISVCGVNPWNFEWRPVDVDEVVVSHPAHPLERHGMRVWEIDTGERMIRFAAGEYSPMIWGFYIRSFE